MVSTASAPLIVAHRGDREHAPENTLPAFEEAMAKGADAVELDVFLTRDGELVVHHDHTLERTTTGNGYVGDFTLAELKRLDAGGWFDSAFTGTPMPTLGEVLELGRSRVRFEIEMRTPTLTFLQRLHDELVRYGVEKDVELTSPHVPLLAAAKRLSGGVRTGLFVPTFSSWLPTEIGQQHVRDHLTLLDARVAHLPVALLDAAFTESLHDGGLLVHAANLLTVADFEQAQRAGADQFSTDRLELALA